MNNSSWEAAQATSLTAPQHTWLTRRRIAISIVGFSSLVVFNIFGAQTIPHNPLALSEPAVALALALLVIGLAVRSWSAGTLNKSRALTTLGPYSLVRNPLYVGSFLMMLGFCILIRDWLALAFVAGPLSVLYWYQVRFEEQRLSHLFPAEWPAYARDTPRFIPWRLTARAWAGWSVAEWLRNREYKAIAATWIGLVGVAIWYLWRTQA